VSKPKLLGMAASLRNARWGIGNAELVGHLASIQEKEALFQFLKAQSDLHLDNFIKAGRAEKKSFQEIYRNLQRADGTRGLSNSEVGLAAGLWAASKTGVDIAHLSLAEFFSASGELRNIARLKREMLDADGILVSGPVYFGDRGSLAESLITFIDTDEELRIALRHRLYGGIAVGAKRNGGQETLLIYQMMDMLNLGMLAVGNDSETTAQYGGTGHAGDIGTMYKDSYGLDTCMGVGRRMARVLQLLHSQRRLSGPPRALFLILSDLNGVAARACEAIVSALGASVKAVVVNVSDASIRRCLACDICPTHIDLDSVYRCIIHTADDELPALHQALLSHDMLIPIVVSSDSRQGLRSKYQEFVERSRYIRRSDYLWSDVLVTPIVLATSYRYDPYPLRLATSFLRHHTVMSMPISGVVDGDSVVNIEEMIRSIQGAADAACRLAAGRLSMHAHVSEQYNPIGYVISADKELEDVRCGRREPMSLDRANYLKLEANQRLVAESEESAPRS
jgi:multimeric flavodoxin WrbA